MADAGGEPTAVTPPRPGLIRGGAVSLLLHGLGLAACLLLRPPAPRPPPVVVVTLTAAAPAPLSASAPAPKPVAAPAPPPDPHPPPHRPKAAARDRAAHPQHRPPPLPPAAAAAAASVSLSTPAAAPALPAASPPQSAGGAGRPGRAAPAPAPAARPGRAVLQDYLRRVHGLLQAHLLYPQAARSLGLDGVVVVRFIIAADGRVREASLAVVGGVDASLLRQEALAAVRSAQPLPPPPLAPMTVQVPVSFRVTG
ncbi:transport protein TonB [mine drainage metagenome]|uniref:Transport protein TonB n=1 Tax=mine drainage metagenome TaxID=410659 RepID=A0A1J5R7S1_9ZZZZ